MRGIVSGGQAELVSDRSRFNAFVYPLNNLDEPKSIRTRFIKTYPDASHFPCAYIFDQQMYQDDDGEPTGTAGSPLLNLLRSYELNRAMIIVARYFGGKKLGTKRLRATFENVAKQALSNSKFGIFRHEIAVLIEGPLDQLGNMHRFVLETGARIENITYNKTISATLIFGAFDPDYMSRRMSDWKIITKNERLLVE